MRLLPLLTPKPCQRSFTRTVGFWSCFSSRRSLCLLTEKFKKTITAGAWLALAAVPGISSAMGLMVDVAPSGCSAVTAPLSGAEPSPIAAAQRVTGSQVARGQRDIAWAWLGSETSRYPHTALGSRFHGGNLHVLLANSASNGREPIEVIYRLPFHRVFEDLQVRLVDLDEDGRDEIVVIEADALRGASVVVYHLRGVGDARTLVEAARSPAAGTTFRWLNIVGFADFDADGKRDIAAVMTPHIGGELTLYHYRPPLLVPYAKAMDTSNHLMGASEQQLAVVIELPGLRPTVIVPNMTLKALHALRWEGSSQTGKFRELADVMALPARIERITPLAGAVPGACVLLADGTWRRVPLTEKP